MFAEIGLVSGAAGAACANAPPANAEIARASVVFLNVFINTPFWLNEKMHYTFIHAISMPVSKYLCKSIT
jgi:hypothetical protein